LLLIVVTSKNGLPIGGYVTKRIGARWSFRNVFPTRGGGAGLDPDARAAVQLLATQEAAAQ
jgi:hypothetical protein